MELTDEIRAQLAIKIKVARREMFGTKSAAYRKAGVNAQTWDNAEAGLPLREDRLVAILKTLWPEHGGSWERLLSPVRQAGVYSLHRSLGGDWDDPSAIEAAEAWLSDLTEEVSYLRNRVDRMERLIFGDAEPGDESWSKLEEAGALLDIIREGRLRTPESPAADRHVLAADDDDHEDEIEQSAEGR